MSITFDEVRSEPPERNSSRRRWAAAVGAAMLVAAAGGLGYGIGRAADDGEAGLARSETQSTDGVATAPTTTVITEPDAADEDTTAGTFPLGDDTVTAPLASGGQGWSTFGSQPMELLFDRTTDAGFTLRAHLGETWDQEFDVAPGDWQPAPWCFESGQLRIALGGNGVVDVGSVPWYREPYQGRAVSWVTLGTIDGVPTWVIVAQAPADTTNVVATLDNGANDATAPQNGIAVLAVPGAAPIEVVESGYAYWEQTAPVFTVDFQGGSTPGVVESDGVGTWNDPDFRAACQPPPPPLPDAGPQPADPAAAEAGIREVMTTLYGAIGSETAPSDLVDDPTGVAEAREAVRDGVFADDAAGALATIAELVFTAPDEAWFRYSIDTPGNDFDNRYGIAVLIDGDWKITRNTVCQDLALAGGDCGGGWVFVQPPGAYGEDGVPPIAIPVPVNTGPPPTTPVAPGD